MKNAAVATWLSQLMLQCKCSLWTSLNGVIWLAVPALTVRPIQKKGPSPIAKVMGTLAPCIVLISLQWAALLFWIPFTIPYQRDSAHIEEKNIIQRNPNDSWFLICNQWAWLVNPPISVSSLSAMSDIRLSPQMLIHLLLSEEKAWLLLMASD